MSDATGPSPGPGPAPRSRGAIALYTVLAAVVAVVALALLVLVQARAESPAERRYAELRMSFVPDSIQELGPVDLALRETSGLAVSAAHPGVLWSHNDSGDEARFYAMDGSGSVVARFDVADVEARDWEAMDRGPCPLDPQASCLYLADTGDNVRRRDVLTVHVVPEPDPSGPSTTVEPAGTPTAGIRARIDR